MKIESNGIVFDSELELEYYNYLCKNKINFFYQNKYKGIQINLGRRKNYTPDFVVYNHEEKTITIIEMKGYAKWSANEDNNIMDFMKNKVATDVEFLIRWLKDNNLYVEGYTIKYSRLKHNKTYGFVDYEWKNPNSLSNRRKEKVIVLENENKALKKALKEYERYFAYKNKEKPTKAQLEWVIAFENSKRTYNI